MQSQVMSIGPHPTLVGHPEWFKGLRRFVRWLGERDGLRITRRIDIARHWMSVHPSGRRQSGDGPRTREGT